jgi:hypothetical protein
MPRFSAVDGKRGNPNTGREKVLDGPFLRRFISDPWMGNAGFMDILSFAVEIKWYSIVAAVTMIRQVYFYACVKWSEGRGPSVDNNRCKWPVRWELSEDERMSWRERWNSVRQPPRPSYGIMEIRIRRTVCAVYRYDTPGISSYVHFLLWLNLKRKFRGHPKRPFVRMGLHLKTGNVGGYELLSTARIRGCRMNLHDSK